MEKQIDLESIFNFLVNTKSTKTFKTSIVNEKLDLDYLEFYNSSNFNYFKDIFTNHVDRIGINLNNKYNNSLYFSVLYILYKDYCLSDNDQQNYLIKVLKEKVKNDMLNRLFKPPRDLTKKLVINTLKSHNNNLIDAYILASYFDINIYVFSYTTKDIKVFYSDEKLNIYKMNIFINEINDIYYPLTYKLDNGRYFKYNSTILNNTIFSNEITGFNIKNNKIYEISNSWEEVLNKYINLDLSNIIIDANNNKFSALLKLEDSDDDDSQFDINNLTDEIKYMEKNMDEINSDNINLDDSEDDESCNDSIEEIENLEIETKVETKEIKDIVNACNDYNILKVLSSIQGYSCDKLKAFKKNELLDFIKILTNNDATSLKSKNKDIIISNLKNEMNKFI